MKTRTGARIAMAVLMLGGTTLAGCAEQQHERVGAWSNQWYQKGKTPEDIAKWRRNHPEQPSRPDDSGDQSPSEAPN